MRLLLIDDDTELCALVARFLEQQGLQVTYEVEGQAGLNRALSGEFDLIVLDVMLPGLDGLEILRRFRNSSRTPVIMLTGRCEENDRILGLELGADDYMPKPFNPHELAARVRAILRREEGANSQQRGRLVVNGVTADPGARQVLLEGRPVELTTIEFDMLWTLMRAAGRVVSREGLIESIYGRKPTPFDRSINVHISHLRRKLETGRELIRTVRGIGYQFRTGSEEEAESA